MRKQRQIYKEMMFANQVALAIERARLCKELRRIREEQETIAIKSASLNADLREALEQAQESERLKNHFLMTASHELRTPLTAIQGYLDLLEEFGTTLPEETKVRFLNNARRACDELVLLLGNVMDASRIEHDRVTLKLTTVSLLKAVETIIEILEPIVKKEQRTVTIQVSADLRVRADDLRLRQILLNLVGNALKYTPAPLNIDITAEQLAYADLVQCFPATRLAQTLSSTKAYGVVAIRDYGAGVTPENQARLFTKFMRLPEAINSTQRGAGLGLYLCRQLTEAMAGYIWMESTGLPGEGSTFFVALPCS
ncbi:MAG TPA: ATP-binding protein [Ktedonosporobacter sp.]|nr:ATP-binding protein [Ktedonosporobacter sp.]